MWLEPPAFQEELVKSPTFHNFADPILHNIVIKDIFDWVYLVSTEKITNRVSLEIIGIGYKCSEMDKDRYSGNYLFKVEAGNKEEEEEQNKILCGGGGGQNSSLRDTLKDDEPPALLSLACMLREALKTSEKEIYMTQKLRLVTSEFLIPSPPPPPTPLANLKQF